MTDGTPGFKHTEFSVFRVDRPQCPDGQSPAVRVQMAWANVIIPLSILTQVSAVTIVMSVDFKKMM